MDTNNKKIYRTYTVTRRVDALLGKFAIQDERSKSQTLRWLVLQEAKRREAQTKRGRK